MRNRPAGGGIVWYPRVNLLVCQGCGWRVPLRGWRNPETVAIVREQMEIAHAVCWEFDETRLANAWQRGLSRARRKEERRKRRDQGEVGADPEVGDGLGYGAQALPQCGARGQTSTQHQRSSPAQDQAPGPGAGTFVR